MERTEQTAVQTKPEFEIEVLEERIAPFVMTGPTGTEHGYPGPGAGGTIASGQYHTTGSGWTFIPF